MKGPTTQPGVMSTGSGEGLSALSFIPIETGEHLIFLSFNNINIPGLNIVELHCITDQSSVFLYWKRVQVLENEVKKPMWLGSFHINNRHLIRHSKLSCQAVEEAACR